MEYLTNKEGFLTGSHASVFNCLNNNNGASTSQNFGGFPITTRICEIKQTAKLNEQGNFLHIKPPQDYSNADDSFAEVMVYYHMNRLNKYLQERVGLKTAAEPLQAITNFMFKIENFGRQFCGRQDDWCPFDNAAFIPKQSVKQLEQQLGGAETGITGDALLFFQGNRIDFTYDSPVIRHEYTHALIGVERLFSDTPDEQGFNNTARAVNEAYADYFAATTDNDPKIGAYSIGALNPAQVRDLSKMRKCPEDLLAEYHADGEIYGSALWDIRTQLGTETADQIIYDALQTFDTETNFETAVESTLKVAASVSKNAETTVKEAFEKRGLIKCKRVKKATDGREIIKRSIPLSIPGKTETGIVAYRFFGTPAPYQVQFELDGQTEALEITATSSAGGGGGGFGGFGGGGQGQPPSIDVAIKNIAENADLEPIKTTIERNGAVNQDASHTLSMKASQANSGGGFGGFGGGGGQGGTNFSLKISGKCLDAKGRLIMQLINKGNSGVSISSLKVRKIKADASLAANCD